MYSCACPACGAQVEFRSAASVMAVCAYCRSTLLREAEAVRSIGRMADIIEDHTRLQITTSGEYQGKHFGIIGRIQLRYADGFWNEWYLLFDDGSTGWLSDGSGQYVITQDGKTPAKAPAFEQIRPGAVIPWNGERYTATDVRTAQCVSGAGELPFEVGAGWEARVADFRSGDKFLTLDYSEGETPAVFLGSATTLETLKCQLLRSTDQVEERAGKLKGKAKALECPNCGSGIDSVPGHAEHLVCPSCHAEVALTADKAEVLAKHDALEKFRSSLQLGDKAKIDGASWQLIGLMRCREFGSDESSTWTEYLLFNASKGFLWLVESDQGWTRTEVLNTLPESVGGTGVRLGGKGYTKKWDYGAEVIYAAGAFNWRVKIGDKTWITDYYGPDGTLSEEKTDAEITWSKSQQIGASQIARWFGKAADSLPEISPTSPGGSNLGRFAKYASFFLLFMSFDHLLSLNVMSWLVTGLALLLLWLPVWSGNGSGDDDGDFDDGGFDFGGGDD